jgi:4,5-dihydroxyphthalate decarboxylase
MAKLKLSFITAKNERIQPLIDGEVEPEGIELMVTHSDPSETFWRQLRFQEFEVCEMSLSSYLIARARGMDMVMLPVFPSRRFWHTRYSIHQDSGVQKAEDLAGKRLGVGEYQQTAALWSRGIFEHDFGVSQFSVDWWMERSEELSHGGATGFKPMDGIKFNRIPPTKSLASMLVNQELDAAPVDRAFSREKNIIDRSTTIRAQDGDWSKVKPLFPDLVAEGKRFVAAHGFVPANHGYAIRGDIYRQYPWTAFNLYTAFVRAKELYNERFAESIPSGLMFGAEYLRQTRQIVGNDPFTYGLNANRPMLETIVSFSHEQGFIPEKYRIEDLFAASTHDL